MVTLLPADIATYVRLKQPDTDRGAFLHGINATGNAVICVFGNDDVLNNRVAQYGIKLVEHSLGLLGFPKVGAGFGRELPSWALLVEVEVPAFQTAVGRAFHIEMMRAALEDLVHRAWRDALRVEA